MLEQKTKILLGKERPLGSLISSILLLICGILSLWMALYNILPFNMRILMPKIAELGITIAILISSFLIFRVNNLEAGTLIALGVGIIATFMSLSTMNINSALLIRGLVPLAASIIGFQSQRETRRRIWLRRIKGFWFEFSHNKIGLVGLFILMIFVFVAIFQDPIAALSYPDPDKQDLAERFAKPAWIGLIDPASQNLPVTVDAILDWNWETLPEDSNVTIIPLDGKWIIQYNRTDRQKIVISAQATLYYPYKPPYKFYYEFRWSALPTNARYSLEINWTTPAGKTYPIWDQHWWRYKAAYCYDQNPFYPAQPMYYPGRWNIGVAPYIYGYGYETYWENRPNPWSPADYRPGYGVYEAYYGGQIPLWNFRVADDNVVYASDNIYPPVRLGYPMWETKKMAADLFTTTGNGIFTAQLYITIEATQTNGTCEIEMSQFRVTVPGLVWGLLGTNFWGQDCWARLIYGARTSLAVGLSAAIIATSIGILVGIVAGYTGGAVDEFLMRSVDVLICIPLLPLLMILVTFWGRNIIYIIIIIAVFGWQGLSRLIRSQVLSIREAPYIDCAKASGGSSSYIMVKHLLPNVLPVAVADFILSVPGAILLEAALSFIGFGDPRTPTWGREYSLMQQEAAIVVPGQGIIWWWFLPPGIAITMLCVAFVFVGHAVDEIVNPRLRRRR